MQPHVVRRPVEDRLVVDHVLIGIRYLDLKGRVHASAPDRCRLIRLLRNLLLDCFFGLCGEVMDRLVTLEEGDFFGFGSSFAWSHDEAPFATRLSWRALLCKGFHHVAWLPVPPQQRDIQRAVNLFPTACVSEEVFIAQLLLPFGLPVQVPNDVGAQLSHLDGRRDWCLAAAWKRLSELRDIHLWCL